jgi:opacity protein-like surface antigen
MNSRHAFILAAMAAAGAGSSVASAAEAGGPWSIAVYVGDTFSSKGKLEDHRTATIANPAALSPTLAGSPATLTLDKLEYDKAYNDNFAAGFEIGYARTEKLDFYGRFDFTQRNGRHRQIGTLNSAALPAPRPLVAHFHDSDAQSLVFGARYFFMSEGTWRPYIGAALGASFTDRMRATMTVTNTPIELRDVEYSRRTTGFSQSAELGLEYNPRPNVGVRLTARADHVGRPQRDAHPQNTALGFNFGDHPDARTSFPIALGVVYRFE